MTVTLSIKNVPDELAQRLRERAARNHRSLQGELMAILEDGVARPVAIASATLPDFVDRTRHQDAERVGQNGARRPR